MTTTAAVIVLTTFPDEALAAVFARTVVEERLAACVSVLPPMASTYRWEGRIEQARECQVIIKTTAAGVDALTRRLSELHPYDVPEVLVLDVAQGGETYLRWLGESVG